ncbi:MAG: hypothetical protein H6607_06035 [Flavobacteriales bacterium]|nr:hypothetical protein [Flavobacteriales bacterium]
MIYKALFILLLATASIHTSGYSNYYTAYLSVHTDSVLESTIKIDSFTPHPYYSERVTLWLALNGKPCLDRDLNKFMEYLHLNLPKLRYVIIPAKQPWLDILPLKLYDEMKNLILISEYNIEIGSPSICELNSERLKDTGLDLSYYEPYVSISIDQNQDNYGGFESIVDLGKN